MKTLMLTAVSALLLAESAAAQHVVDPYAGLTDVSYEEVVGVSPERAGSPRAPRASESSSEQFVGATLAAFLGGGIGALGALYMGASSRSFEGTIYSVYAGHIVGAAAGASIVTGDPGNSLLGSVVGSALGFAFASMGEDTGWLYIAVHSFTTGLVATR